MNAAQLPLMAGVLAVLALGVVGAAPGISLAPGAAAPSCSLHLSINAPTQVAVGGPFLINSVVTTHGGCHVTVSDFAYSGVPGWSGTVASTSGVMPVFPNAVGMYDITVIATTSLGSIGATAQMQVV